VSADGYDRSIDTGERIQPSCSYCGEECPHCANDIALLEQDDDDDDDDDDDPE